MNNYKIVLFDLDGTLIDTSRGIFNSVRYAEKMMGFCPIKDEQLKQFVGPPPVQSYMGNYGVSEEVARVATKYHREYGAQYGIYEAEVYSGIPQLLETLKAEGIKLGVCTLKRQDIAEKVLGHFGILSYFDAVIGIDQQESLTKADTIELALKKLGENDKKKVVLVGDSIYDADGAKEAEIDFVGVLYGLGLEENHDYNTLVCNVTELINIL